MQTWINIEKSKNMKLQQKYTKNNNRKLKQANNKCTTQQLKLQQSTKAYKYPIYMQGNAIIKQVFKIQFAPKT
jgi:hypothetical protein